MKHDLEGTGAVTVEVSREEEKPRGKMVFDYAEIKKTANGGVIVRCFKKSEKPREMSYPGYQPPVELAFTEYDAAEAYVRKAFHAGNSSEEYE